MENTDITNQDQRLTDEQLTFIDECYRTNFSNPSGIVAVMYMKKMSNERYVTLRDKVIKEFGRIKSNENNPNSKFFDPSKVKTLAEALEVRKKILLRFDTPEEGEQILFVYKNQTNSNEPIDLDFIKKMETRIQELKK